MGPSRSEREPEYRDLRLAPAPRLLQHRHQPDDDGEERRAFDHRRRDDHRGRNLAGRRRLPSHRFHGRPADPADAGGAAHDREAGANRAAQPARAVARESACSFGRSCANAVAGNNTIADTDHREPEGQPVNFFRSIVRSLSLSAARGAAVRPTRHRSHALWPASAPPRGHGEIKNLSSSFNRLKCAAASCAAAGDRRDRRDETRPTSR